MERTDELAPESGERQASQPHRGREVAAAALLVAIGAVSVFLPYAVAALFSGIFEGSGPSQLLRVAGIVAYAPAVGIVALLPGLALYRRWSWGRAAALAVALLLAASPVVAVVSQTGNWLETGEASLTSDISPAAVVQVLLWHVFVVQNYGIGISVAAGAAGIGILVSLVDRVRMPIRARRTVSSVEPPRTAQPGAVRPSLAFALLILVGLGSIAPYLGWLVIGSSVPQAEAHGGPAVSTGTGPVAAIGLALAIPTAIASITALAAARAIRRRSVAGIVLAPAASLVAGPWSALAVIIAGQTLVRGGGDADAGAESSLLGAVLTILAIFLAAAALPVTANVIARRRWFVRDGGTGDGGTTIGRRRALRLWPVTTGVALVLSLPLVLAVAASISAGDPPDIRFGEVQFDGRPYTQAAPVLDEPGIASSNAGTLDAWAADIDVADPIVHVVDGVDSTELIVIAVHWDGSQAALMAFVPRDSFDDMGNLVVPAGACPHLAIGDPSTFVEPCGPARQTALDGDAYVAIDAHGLDISTADLTKLSAEPALDLGMDPRIDGTPLSIRDVPVTEAFAVEVGARIVVYRSTRTVATQLCRYAPDAIRSPLFDMGKFDERDNAGDYPMIPEGCGFPTQIEFDGLSFEILYQANSVLAVPAAALSAVGEAQRIEYLDEFEETTVLPFAPIFDPTVYRIEGIDPTVAVALSVDDKVLVFGLGNQESGIPAELCRYVSAEELSRHREDSGDTESCPGTAS